MSKYASRWRQIPDARNAVDGAPVKCLRDVQTVAAYASSAAASASRTGVGARAATKPTAASRMRKFANRFPTKSAASVSKRLGDVVRGV